VNDAATLRKLLAQGKADEYLSLKLDLYNRRAEDTRNLLVYLLAIGGFITTLQGLFAYFNVQIFTRQADETVKKLVEQNREAAQRLEAEGHDAVARLESEGSKAMIRLKEIRSAAEAAKLKSNERLKSVELQLPVFAQMDQVIKEAVDQLQRFFKEPDTLTDSYESLSPLERQKIIHYEQSVAGLEFTELPALRKNLASIYRGLSVFYASKHFDGAAALRKLGNGCPTGCLVTLPFNDREDLARARMYAEIARGKSDNPYCVENDLAWMALQERSHAIAEEHCRRSLACYPNQQRALSNLGISLFWQRKFGEAINVLRQANGYEVWEAERTDLKSRVHYNLACALVKSAEEAKEPGPLLKEAITELQLVLDYSTAGLLRHFDEDTRENGDLWALMSSGRFSEQLQAVRAKLS
jgi:hypothetical protein